MVRLQSSHPTPVESNRCPSTARAIAAPYPPASHKAFSAALAARFAKAASILLTPPSVTMPRGLKVGTGWSRNRPQSLIREIKVSSDTTFSLTPDRLTNTIEWQAIDHVLPLQPSFPGNLHPKPEIFESRHRMSIRIDRTENPFGFC
jgi:hypothetical protein